MKKSLDVNSKSGFVSLFGIVLLLIAISFLSLKISTIQLNSTMDKQVSIVEIHAIQNVKNVIKEDTEDSVNITFLAYNIRIQRLEDEHFELQIRGDDSKLIVFAYGKYDATSKRIMSYEYYEID